MKMVLMTEIYEILDLNQALQWDRIGWGSFVLLSYKK